MSDLVRDEESLLKLRTCPVCKTVVETLKVLSCCYYTICLPCTNSLTVHRSRFNCYNCNKEVLLPNGGFGYLPDSALTKLLTELDKQRTTNNDSRSLTVEDLDLTKLREDLENEIAAALRWIKQAIAMRLKHHLSLQELPKQVFLMIASIGKHLMNTDVQCQKKLAALTERLDKEGEELEESIKTLQTYNNTRKSVREVIHKIRSTVDVEESFNHLSEAKQLLDKLSELHKKVKDLNSYLDSSVELEEGDSVRLNYNIKDKMEEFIRGNVTHSSVGILVHKPKDNDDVAVVLFPEKYNWKGKSLSGLVKSLEKSKLPFIDDKVWIDTKKPRFDWKGLKGCGRPGILKKIDHTESAPGDDVVVYIDFPEVKNWKGLYSEIVTRDADEELKASGARYQQLYGGNILQQITYMVGGMEPLTTGRELVPLTGSTKVNNCRTSSRKKKVQPATPTAAELRSKLQQLHDEGAKWTTSSTDMTRRIRSILDSLPGKVLRTREEVKRYKTEIDERCEQKLYDEQIAVQDISAKLRDYADLLRDHLQSISHAKQTCKRSLSTISAGSVVDVSTLVQVQQCLLSLKAVNCKVRAICYGVDSFYEHRTGDCFRLLEHGFDAHGMSRYINGSLTLGSVGVLLGLFKVPNSGMLMALMLFPDEEKPWIVPYKLIQRVLTERKVPYVGDKVVLKTKAITLEPSLPSDESRDNTRCHGILKEMSHPGAEVKFPWQEESWKGLYKGLELAPGCGFEVGDKVWVRRTIPEPTRGWGRVNGSSVGTVKSIEEIEGEEEITVDFPECKDWVGLSTDLQLTRDARQDDEVQVKLSVTEPRRGWQNYSHDSFGVLYRVEKNGECASGFSCDRPFICDLDEIEPHRFQRPYYDIPESERVDQGTFVSPAAMREYFLKCEAARRPYDSDSDSSSD